MSLWTPPSLTLTDGSSDITIRSTEWDLASTTAWVPYGLVADDDHAGLMMDGRQTLDSGIIEDLPRLQPSTAECLDLLVGYETQSTLPVK